MKITRENYESWFLDYLEGCLKEEMINEFLEFIHENPDLKTQLPGWEMVPLATPLLTFKGKEKLYKENFDLPEEFDQVAIARMEGDLDLETAEKFHEYLYRHPEKQPEMDLLLLTRLKSDPSVAFPSRNRLHQTPAMRRIITWTMQVAAILVMVLAVYALFDQPTGYPIEDSALTETNTEPAIPNQPSGIEDAGTIHMNNPGQLQTVNHITTEGIATLSGKLQTSALPSPADMLAETHTRTRENVPELMPVKNGLLRDAVEIAAIALHNVPRIKETVITEQPETIPFSERMIEKTGLADINFNRITRWGLNMAADLTREKFSYETNSSGDIITYNLETRLLGLSIPVRKKNSEW